MRVSRIFSNSFASSEALDAFKPKRELRQGALLSLYLFVLYVETVGHHIQKIVEVGHWKGIKLARSSNQILHLFFADDLVLFGEAIEKQAKVIQQILQDFCETSGQKVNLAK